MQFSAANNHQHLSIYYQRVLTAVLVIAYAMLHLKLTGLYDQATLQRYYDGDVRLPYGQRMLVPLLARVLGGVFSFLSVGELFLLWEVIFVALCYWATKRLMLIYFGQKQAIALSWLFLLLMPLVFVVNYRLLSNDISTIFYPNDTAVVFFMALGLSLCLQQAWQWFMLVVALATINRESSLLLVLLIPCLQWQKPWKQWLPALAGSVIAFLIAKTFILWMTADLPGTYTEWFYRSSETTIFHANFYFLTSQHVLFFYCYAFACLPVFIFSFYDYIPHQLRPIRWLCLAYFLGLIMVGHVLEARIYAEIVVLLYLPAVLSVSAWLSNQQPLPYKLFKFTTLADRYGISLILIFLLVFRAPINLLVVKLANFMV